MGVVMMAFMFFGGMHGGPFGEKHDGKNDAPKQVTQRAMHMDYKMMEMDHMHRQGEKPPADASEKKGKDVHQYLMPMDHSMMQMGNMHGHGDTAAGKGSLSTAADGEKAGAEDCP